MVMMSSLSEEQKLKIEENKRKALALRAAKQNAQSSKPFLPRQATYPPVKNVIPNTLSVKPTSTFVPTQNKFIHNLQKSNLFKPATNSNTTCLGVQKISTFQSQPVKTLCNTGHNPTYQQNSKNTLPTPTASSWNKVKKESCDGYTTYGNRTSNEESNLISMVTAPSPNKANNASIKGKCILVSQTRFMVDIGYSGAVIEVFKTMPSRQYDAETKKWSFELQEYNMLIQKMNNLGSYVQVEPLPRTIVTAFSKSLKHQSCKDIQDVDLKEVDDVLVSSLFPFQKDAINFAVQHRGRVLIADDMGLGKTLQSLCVAAYYRREWPLLIVVPSSVRFSWREQIIKWLPSVDPQSINVVVTGKDNCTTGVINIVSYDLMVKMKKQLNEKQFKVIIMDESHCLKNSKTARTQAALPMLKRASRVILLSGTPALSRPSELFSQINAVDESIFPKFHDFGVRYCDGKQNPWGWDFSGSSNLAELQLILEEKIMIRRLKKDVVDQLPEKCRQMVILDPHSVKINKHMKASHTLMDKMKGNERRGALLEYFHETGGAKVKAIREYVLDLLESDRKFILFAHHQQVLNSVEEAVSKKFEYIRIDGRTTSEQRNCLVTKFQKHDDVKIAILSITAANSGINLTAASLVVFAELFWNPGILMQAEDRAHRIGQQDSVTVHYLVAPSTADDYIWPLVQQKLEVLGRAGLSKDDFSEANTKRLKDPRQKEILDFFEESFMDDSTLNEMDEDIPCNNNDDKKTYERNIGQGSSGQQHQSSLFNYFKPPDCSSNDTSKKDSTLLKEQNKNNECDYNDTRSIGNNEHCHNQQKDLLDYINEEWDDGNESFNTIQDVLADDWDDDGDDPDAPWPPKPKKAKY